MCGSASYLFFDNQDYIPPPPSLPSPLTPPHPFHAAALRCLHLDLKVMPPGNRADVLRLLPKLQALVLGDYAVPFKVGHPDPNRGGLVVTPLEVHCENSWA